MQKRLSFRIISILSTLVLLLNCFMVQAATPANQFSDVKESAWYYTAVKYAVENNLMNGVGGGKFDPNGAASRAMLVTLLYRMEGKPSVSLKTPFTDLKDDWYKAPIAWAYANKIVNGTSNTTFGPTNPLTREQFATIMYRYCKESLGLDVSTNAQLSGYPDHKSISDYAKTAMIWANAEGMITGSIESGKVYLRPQQTATRAQMATIFQRFDTYLEQKEEQETPVAPPAQAPCDYSGEPNHKDGTRGMQSKHIYFCRDEGCVNIKEVPCTIQVQTIPATCKEYSKSTYSCALCGYEETIVNSSEPLDHNWDETPAHIDGTSGAQSKHIYFCREDGCNGAKEVPCTIQVQTIPATCKEYAKSTYSCALCGYEQTIVNTSEPLGDHNWDETPSHIDGTSGTQSKHIYCCREDGCDGTQEVPCTIQVQTIPATCKEYSKSTYSCALCGYEETIVNSSEPLDHNWDETPAHIDGTSGAQSKHIYFCREDGCNGAKEVPCTIQVQTIPATCKEYAKSTYSCALCGYEQTIVNTSEPLGDHNWDETPSHIDGTSGTQSKHIYCCREDGCDGTQEVPCTIQVQTIPATCYEYSKTTYSCATCGYEDTIVNSSQPLAEHNWSEEPSHKVGTSGAQSKHIYFCREDGCNGTKEVSCDLTVTKTPAEIGKDGTINYYCALCGYTHSVPDPDAPALKEQSDTVIKLMSQNLKYDDEDDQGTDNDARIRQYRLKALVEKYDPDVIGTQEFDAFWESAMPTLFGEDYEMYFEYRDHRNPPKGSNEASAILWKKDKFELLEQGYFWLSENPNSTVPGFGQYYPRICNWVRLKDKQSGKIVRIASTHFGIYKDDDGNPDTYPVEVIRKLFEKECEKAGDEPYIFMGDFNLPYQQIQYDTLTDTNAFYDLRPAAEAAAKKGQCELGDIRTGTNNGFNLNNLNGKNLIDYIFAGNNAPVGIQKFGYCYDRIAVPKRGISKGFVSDHFAVYAEVKI